MAGNREILLHLLELGRRDLGIGVFLPVHHAGLQRGEHVGKGHRRRVGAILLEHLHAPFPVGCAQLDALEILGHVDWTDVVGDVAKPVLGQPNDMIAVVVGGGLERVHHRALNAAHVVAILNDIGHLKNAKETIDRRHHRRGQRKVDLPQLELLQQFLVIAQLRRAKGLNLGLATGFLTHAGGEVVGGRLEKGPRFAHMAKAHGNVCRNCRHRHKGRHHGCEYCFFHCLPPLVFMCARFQPRLGLSLL